MPTPEKHALHALVKAGDLAGIRALPSMSVGEMNAFDSQRYTPLMYAVGLRQKGVPILRELLQRGAWIDIAGQNLLSLSLAGGDPQMLPALLDAGLDITTTDANGYDALLQAVHGRHVLRDPRLIDSLKLLIARGAPLNGVSGHQKSAMGVLAKIGRFDAVRWLLDAGFDAGHLKWTPLMHAVACGSLDEVRAHLQGANLEQRDPWERTAWLLAVRTGDIAKAEALRDAGADLNARGVCGMPALFHAIESDASDMLKWLLDQGISVQDTDRFGTPALRCAVEHVALKCMEVLLQAGVDVNQEHEGKSALRSASSAQVAGRLLQAGADPAHISDESRREFLGLEREPDIYSMTASFEDFSRARMRRFGVANPEPIDEPFWESMIRAGVSAYAAAKSFGTSPLHKQPVWCAQRYGQSLTFLDDGRIIQIGGEHEDHYDPDFCIYNDVFVHEPPGAIRIYGYPESLFPPTDFHTATLIGDWIYIVGCLGYPEQRRFGETPIFRLHLHDFHSERLQAAGEAPGWIYGHRAQVLDSRFIRIFGGTVATLVVDEEEHSDNHKAYLLDTHTLLWSS